MMTWRNSSFLLSNSMLVLLLYVQKILLVKRCRNVSHTPVTSQAVHRPSSGGMLRSFCWSLTRKITWKNSPLQVLAVTKYTQVSKGEVHVMKKSFCCQVKSLYIHFWGIFMLSDHVKKERKEREKMEEIKTEWKKLGNEGKRNKWERSEGRQKRGKQSGNIKYRCIVYWQYFELLLCNIWICRENKSWWSKKYNSSFLKCTVEWKYTHTKGYSSTVVKYFKFVLKCV